MSSEIRVNKINNRAGLGTVTYADTGIIVSGIVTCTELSGLTALNIAGVGTASTLDINGDIDVDGHTNLDNVSVAGVSTFSDNLRLIDNKKIQLGNSQDLEVYHDASDSHIANTTGVFFIQNTGDLRIRVDNTDASIHCVRNGAVELYHNNIKRLETSEKGIQVGTGVTIETNGQATYTGIVTATAFQLADGSAIGAGAGGTWSSYTAGIATTKSVGINTNNLDDNDLVGVGNSFQGLYISNGMMVMDNKLSGNHYIGTAFNGLMAGPVNIEGTLTIDGNYVVV